MLADYGTEDVECETFLNMFNFSDNLESASNIEEESEPITERPDDENFGEISFTMRFDLETTTKTGENRLLINITECRQIPRHPLVSHPYVKGRVHCRDLFS